MIVESFQAAKRLDAMVRDRLGAAYNALLGLGIAAEIVRRVRELEQGDSHGGLILSALAIAMFGFILLHQLAELSEHVERRFRRGMP